MQYPVVAKQKVGIFWDEFLTLREMDSIIIIINSVVQPRIAAEKCSI